MNRFTSKISFIIISFFMFAIMISFALTGFKGLDSSIDVVAKVDGTTISSREYQISLNQKLDYYSKIFGGNALSAQQIRQFRLKESTLQELISQKLVSNLADVISLGASKDEVKSRIKELPFFKTNDRFDVNKYKSKLLANNFTPGSYEETFNNDLKLQKIAPFISGLSVSNGYTNDLLKFKKNSAITSAVEIEKESLIKHLEVSDKEINEFLADAQNKNILESLYKSQSNKFNTPEKVQASHILLKTEGKNESEVLKLANELRAKLNLSNFAKIANEKTEDPSGKGKGGDLGWFEKGRMVPNFEKVAFSSKPGSISQPVKTEFGYHIIYVKDKKAAVNKTLAQVERQLAKEHLQKSNRKELNNKVEQLTEKISKMLQDGDFTSIQKLEKTYQFKLELKKELNVFDLKVGNIALDEEDVISAWSKREAKKLISKDMGSRVVVAYISKFKDENEVKSEIEKSFSSELSTLNQKLNSEFYRNLVENLQNKANIVTYPKML